jgi:hypothetical protein
VLYCCSEVSHATFWITNSARAYWMPMSASNRKKKRVLEGFGLYFLQNSEEKLLLIKRNLNRYVHVHVCIITLIM